MLLAGYGVSLAQLTVAGITAYLVAILGDNSVGVMGLGWPWWLTVPAAILAGAVLGALIGAISVRTEGIYTIMITLAIAVVSFFFVRQNYVLFNGWTGFAGVEPPTLFGIYWRDPVPFYYLSLLVAGGFFCAVAYVSRSTFGLGLQAIRDNPRRMRALGFDVALHRIFAFFLAGLIAATAGVPPGLVQRPRIARHDGGRGVHRHPRHRRRRRPAPSDRPLPRGRRVRAARELRDRSHRPRALQHGHRAGLPCSWCCSRPMGCWGSGTGSVRGSGSTETRGRSPDAPQWTPRANPRAPDNPPARENQDVPNEKNPVHRGRAARGAAPGSPALPRPRTRSRWAPSRPSKARSRPSAKTACAASPWPSKRSTTWREGRRFELVTGSSDASPDSAIRATRKLVEQDGVRVMVGPLSGSEGLAVKDYAKTQPDVTFVNGTSAAQDTTLRGPGAELLPLQHRRRAVDGRPRRVRLAT